MRDALELSWSDPRRREVEDWNERFDGGRDGRWPILDWEYKVNKYRHLLDFDAYSMDMEPNEGKQGGDGEFMKQVSHVLPFCYPCGSGSPQQYGWPGAPTPLLLRPVGINRYRRYCAHLVPSDWTVFSNGCIRLNS